MADVEADRESTKKPFFERSLFKAAVAVIGLLGAVWALLGAPKPWEVAKEITAAAPLPLKNTEIILDASSRMKAPFGRVTKLDVAAIAVGEYAASSEKTGLALRRVGGSCRDPGPPLVDFGQGHDDDVEELALDQEPEGKSNLALVVRTAIAEFDADPRFHRPDAKNQVMVFVGGENECGGIAGQEIADELKDSDIETVFRFFALKVSKKTMKSLEEMKRQLRSVAKVEVRQANTLKQVYRAVSEVEEEEKAEEEAAAGPVEAGSRDLPEEPEAESSSAAEQDGEEEAEAEPTPGETAEPGEEAEAEAEGEGEGEEPPEPLEEGPSEAEGPEAPQETEEAPREEVPPAPRKAFSSVFGYRPMTVSWTPRPNSAGRPGNSLLPH